MNYGNTTSARRLQAMTAQRIHLLRVKSFYEIKNEMSPDLLTLIYDCQQKLAFPRLLTKLYIKPGNITCTMKQ